MDIAEEQLYINIYFHVYVILVVIIYQLDIV